MAGISVETEELPPGVTLAEMVAFMTSLSGGQRRAFTPIWRSIALFVRKHAGKRSRTAAADPDARRSTNDALSQVMGQLTAGQLRELILNGIERGDANVLRVIAAYAGVDLTPLPQAASAEGARIIIFRRYGDEMSAEEVEETVSGAGETASF